MKLSPKFPGLLLLGLATPCLVYVASYLAGRLPHNHSHYISCKDLDEHGSTEESELGCSAQWGEYEKANALIRSGADMNAKDEYGLTPLMRAGDIKMARLLLAHGADLKAVGNEGKNVLGTGWYGGDDVGMFRFFLWRGADPYQQDNAGESMASMLAHSDGASDPLSPEGRYLAVLHRYEDWKKPHFQTK